jgi:hypothetical protein
VDEVIEEEEMGAFENSGGGGVGGEGSGSFAADVFGVGGGGGGGGGGRVYTASIALPSAGHAAAPGGGEVTDLPAHMLAGDGPGGEEEGEEQDWY